MKNRTKYVVLGVYTLLLLLLDIPVTYFYFSFDRKSVTGQLFIDFFSLVNPLNNWFWSVSVITGISGIIANLIAGIFILCFLDFLITNYKRINSPSALMETQWNQLQVSSGFKVMTAVFLLMLTLCLAYSSFVSFAFGLVAEIGLVGMGLFVLPVFLSFVGLVAWILFKKPWGLIVSVLSIVVRFVATYIMSLYIK